MDAASRSSVYASIDVGSHTIRLLVAELTGSKELIPLRVERRITRLAQGFQQGDTLKNSGIESSIIALKEYTKLLDLHGAHCLVCGATGVIRRARNRFEFLDSVLDATGIECSIVSEESEALLSTKGVLSVLSEAPYRVLAFDLGGSSTEFTLSQGNQLQPVWSTSIFTGAATITERFLTAEDPPDAASIGRARSAIRKAFAPVIAAIDGFSENHRIPSFMVVGTAGTVTTLAAMHLEMTSYEPYRVNGLSLGKSRLTEIINLLVRLPLAARRGLPGLEMGREDIILGGALIVEEILNALKLDELTVTDSGLLEGLLLDLVEKENGWPRSLATLLTWRLQKG